MIDKKKLHHYLQHNLNVLLIGRHGVGKTQSVLEVFEEAGLKYKYFSASTLDPWIDFIGVPKEVEVNGTKYLDLVRPKEFANDEVEAIFLDEYNRSRPQLRNAVMELIQFKSINGKKFKNLRVVWAAINPEDDEELKFDVEPLDPAQKDRFPVHINVRYDADMTYFSDKYGKQGKGAVAWWRDLKTDDTDFRKDVSPRRLEEAIKLFNLDCDLTDVIPKHTNISKLIKQINFGDHKEELYKFVKRNDTDGGKEFLRTQNNYDMSIKHIMEEQDLMDFFLPLIQEEKLASICDDDRVLEYLVKNYNTKSYGDIVDNKIRDTATRNKINSIIENITPDVSSFTSNTSPQMKFVGQELSGNFVSGYSGVTYKGMHSEKIGRQAFLDRAKELKEKMQNGKEERVKAIKEIFKSVYVDSDDVYNAVTEILDIYCICSEITFAKELGYEICGLINECMRYKNYKVSAYQHLFENSKELWKFVNILGWKDCLYAK